MSRLGGLLREFRRRGDPVLLVLCVLASLFGIALIYSATRWTGGYRSVVVQTVALVVGVVIYIALTFVDFQALLEHRWRYVLAFNVGFLLLLLTPLGTDNNSGNLNWIAIPHFPLDLQPNEIVKITFVLLLAFQISRLQEDEHDLSSVPSMLMLTAHAMLMIGLIALICGDMGMCLVYLCIFIIMLWTAGIKLRWFALGMGLLAGGAVLAW